jgi:hypothetical protein
VQVTVVTLFQKLESYENPAATALACIWYRPLTWIQGVGSNPGKLQTQKSSVFEPMMEF